MVSGPDAARLLAAVADALNACERAGIALQLAQGTVFSEYGYVLPAGDPRIGSRWAAKPRVPGTLTPGQVAEDEDP